MNQAANEQWFAIHVRTRFEKIATSILEEKGLEVFLPLQVVRQKWSDRNKEIERPLFAGYVFCRFDPSVRLPILTTSGVIGIVGGPQGPLPVDQSEIEFVRRITESGRETEVVPFVPSAHKVLVVKGPLAGVEGVVIIVKNRYRIVVSVSLLGRSVLAEIDTDWVREIELERTAVTPRTIPQRFLGDGLIARKANA